MFYFNTYIFTTMTKRKRERSRTPRECEISNLAAPPGSYERSRAEGIMIVMFMILLTFVGAAGNIYTYFLAKEEDSEKKSAAAKAREPRIRSTWEKENEQISHSQFYRLFRMTRPCFKKLVKKIRNAVGEKEFKSQTYLENLNDLGYSTQESRMYQARKLTNGEDVSGEVKLAMTLRLLAGASYLDMFLWFNVSPDHVRAITRYVMKHWICNDEVVCIDFFKTVLQDQENRDRIRSNFARKTDGVMCGVIGALDGWLVRIQSPTFKEVCNPGKYFSRKGFYAINCQVIVDMKKRVLWRHIGEKGSSHDSPVFKESFLGRHLVEIAAELMHKGLYLVGDSAYAIRLYLLVPYDNARPGSKEDSFNFFLSSKRIYVECAFGEIDRRWGIFWKPLLER